jgi:hypothetical protein
VCSLHGSLEVVSAGHAAPPKAASVSTIRLRVRVPPPQGFEQLVGRPYSNLQSTGIMVGSAVGCMVGVPVGVPVGAFVGAQVPEAWQGLVSSRSATLQDPPCWFSDMTSRWRRCTPSPQVAEHAPHCPHEDSEQSTGQCLMRQERRASRIGHSTAPEPRGSCTTVRCLLSWPVPHVLSHAVQLPQSDTWQSITCCVVQSSLPHG